jgi:leucyl/phenylalanyl-tRNA--protein transferase
MTRHDAYRDRITPEVILRAYTIGIFPMAERADAPSIHWVEPRFRGIIPFEALHLSKSLTKTLRSNRFEIRVDHDFDGVISGCATRPGGTWINQRIKLLYGQLFERGLVHTVEVYQDRKLVGGIYGVSIGAAFFGESMFHRVTDASKVALAHLVARLIYGQYELLDTQFLTPHLATLGGIEIPRDDYQTRLTKAIVERADFTALDPQDHADGSIIIDIIKSRKKRSIRTSSD